MQSAQPRKSGLHFLGGLLGGDGDISLLPKLNGMGGNGATYPPPRPGHGAGVSRSTSFAPPRRSSQGGGQQDDEDGQPQQGQSVMGNESFKIMAAVRKKSTSYPGPSSKRVPSAKGVKFSDDHGEPDSGKCGQVKPAALALPAVAQSVGTSQGVSLGFLQTLRQNIHPGLTLEEVFRQLVVPSTQAGRCAYVDIMGAEHRGRPTHAVVCGWKQHFSQAVALITEHFEAEEMAALANSDAPAPAPYLWIDLFAVDFYALTGGSGTPSNRPQSVPNLETAAVERASGLPSAIAATRAVLLLPGTDGCALREHPCTLAVWHTLRGRGAAGSTVSVLVPSDVDVELAAAAYDTINVSTSALEDLSRSSSDGGGGGVTARAVHDSGMSATRNTSADPYPARTVRDGLITMTLSSASGLLAQVLGARKGPYLSDGANGSTWSPASAGSAPSCSPNVGSPQRGIRLSVSSHFLGAMESEGCGPGFSGRSPSGNGSGSGGGPGISPMKARLSHGGAPPLPGGVAANVSILANNGRRQSGMGAGGLGEGMEPNSPKQRLSGGGRPSHNGGLLWEPGAPGSNGSGPASNANTPRYSAPGSSILAGRTSGQGLSPPSGSGAPAASPPPRLSNTGQAIDRLLLQSHQQQQYPGGKPPTPTPMSPTGGMGPLLQNAARRISVRTEALQPSSLSPSSASGSPSPANRLNINSSNPLGLPTLMRGRGSGDGSGPDASPGGIMDMSSPATPGRVALVPTASLRLCGYARLLLALGQIKHAHATASYALDMLRNAFGAQHPDTARCQCLVAQMLHQLGQPGEAEASFRFALAALEKMLGPNHVDTQVAVHGLAEVLAATKRYDEACDLFQRALQHRATALGVAAEPTLATTYAFACVLVGMARKAEADTLLKGMVARLQDAEDAAAAATAAAAVAASRGIVTGGGGGGGHQRGLSAPQIDTSSFAAAAGGGLLRGVASGPAGLTPLKQEEYMAKAAHKLGMLKDQAGKAEMAKALYKRAVQGYIQVYGRRHTKTAGCMSNLASLYRALKQYEDAQDLYRIVLNIFQDLLGPQNNLTLRISNHLTAIEEALEEQQEAQEEEEAARVAAAGGGA